MPEPEKPRPQLSSQMFPSYPPPDPNAPPPKSGRSAAGGRTRLRQSSYISATFEPTVKVVEVAKPEPGPLKTSVGPAPAPLTV